MFVELKIEHRLSLIHFLEHQGSQKKQRQKRPTPPRPQPSRTLSQSPKLLLVPKVRLSPAPPPIALETVTFIGGVASLHPLQRLEPRLNTTWGEDEVRVAGSPAIP